jgi:two-component system chemotaxis response regulator CheY
MSGKPKIISVDDQREVLAALEKDLQELSRFFDLFFCESAEEAKEVIEEIDAEGGHIPLIICDHIMPGMNGIDFLIDLNQDERFRKIRKMLLTGLATHKDTINAINDADIDFYIEKPWEKVALLGAIKKLVTRYVVDEGMDYKDLTGIIDPVSLYKAIREKEA